MLCSETNVLNYYRLYCSGFPTQQVEWLCYVGGNRQLCLEDICFCNLLFPRENPFWDLSKTQDGNPRPKNTSVERVSFRPLMFPLYKSIFYSIQWQNEARAVRRHVCCSWHTNHPLNIQKCACRLRTFSHTLLFSQYLGIFPFFKSFIPGVLKTESSTMM